MKSKQLIILLSVLIAFAANSLLSRMALHSDQLPLIDPSSFVFIRLFSGAVFLCLFVFLNTRLASNSDSFFSFRPIAFRPSALHFRGAVYLFIYAATFSFAYILLNTGVGALILFGSVQLSILLLSVIQGKRLSLVEWLGCGLAIAGLLVLTLPSILSTPSISMGTAASARTSSGFADDSLLMVTAGVAWGLFTLNGMQSREPVKDMTWCFVLSVPMALVFFVYQFSLQVIDITLLGAVYAVLSGAVASGLGYALWYSLLPELSTAQAASSQLLVPIIAALAGLFILSEPLSLTFILSTVLTLGGVALVIWQSNRKF